MSYATDGKCHNAQPGSFNHECGRPAEWLGTKANGHQSGFCDDCKRHGFEATPYKNWQRISVRTASSHTLKLTLTPDGKFTIR